MPKSSKPRARLSEAQVITIFKAKTTCLTASALAPMYGVSEKAVRDIWTGRTWSRETWHLDKARPLRIKQTGRPKGCRDAKPRTKRVVSHGPTSSGQQRINAGSGEGQTLKQKSKQSTHQITSRMVGLDQETDLQACINNAGAWQGSAALLHSSLNDQLHEWDEFWRCSKCDDPFRDD